MPWEHLWACVWLEKWWQGEGNTAPLGQGGCVQDMV